MTTNFPNGITSRGVPVTASGLAGLVAPQGDVYFVKPVTGADGNTGKSIAQAFKTIEQAYNATTANQNDIIFFIPEGNSADNSSSRVSTTLTWAKDMVHLIGVNNGVNVSPRSRLAFVSTVDAAVPLLTVSANGCLFANFQFFMGVAGTLPVGAVNVTGDRNHFVNCHIAGIGNDANDIAGAYSLKLDTASENKFSNCTFGITTIGAGSAANAEVLVDGSSARNEFTDCKFTRRVDHASNFVFIQLADATAIEDYLLFDNCRFIPTSTNYAIAMGAISSLPILTQGVVIYDRCSAFKSDNSTAPKWDVNDRDKSQIVADPTPAADTAGVGRQV